jgi:hypothetical protein
MPQAAADDKRGTLDRVALPTVFHVKRRRDGAPRGRSHRYSPILSAPKLWRHLGAATRRATTCFDPTNDVKDLSQTHPAQAPRWTLL